MNGKNSEVRNWHLKFRPRRTAPPSLRVHRTWCNHGGKCPQQRTGCADERFVWTWFLENARIARGQRELAQKLASLEKELKKRLDVHEAVIVTILQLVMDIIDPPALPPSPPKPRIGLDPDF